MAAIPLELQIMVVEGVYRASQHNEPQQPNEFPYATLRACALVCRAWTPTAQRLMLRRLPIPIHFSTKTHRRAALLLRTIRDRPVLATHITSVKFDLVRLDGVNLDNPCVSLLELCPRITCIRVSCFFDMSWQWQQLAMRLRSLPLRPVVLCIAGVDMAISDLIHMWPTVRVLDIGMWSQTINGHLLRDLSSLEALSVTEINAFNLMSPEVNLSALRELEIKTEWGEDFRHRVFGSSVFARIRSLKVDGTYPPPEVFQHMVHLENLAFSELPEGNLSFPQTLQHVGYHPSRFLVHLEHNKNIKPFVTALRTLPSLQGVSATSMLPPKRTAILKEVCHERGIDLEICYDPDRLWLVKRPKNVDWI
ncbi:hypothetical protein FA95DRAFT_1610411 [Auriscalpium vulgare]|uniref:Uncharacterized protein n=1 Tax=Auriscalpium vulgare TaxID=40419 RepID=A0ACB8RDA9_9AGAM|nr:hypothetical protein FA95DRAFT_1610411 [Auriscalpium vulgare]